MQFSVPDPYYVSSDSARRSFRLALKSALGFIALLWLIRCADWAFTLELYRWGVTPRQLDGLAGILLAPLLHSNFAHLFANSVPLLVLGTGVLYLYPNAAFKVIPIIYIGSGILVWLLARPPVHIGASGLVYGLLCYVLVAGIVRLDVRAIAAAMLVFFLYGTLLWGVLPIRVGMSWETHLAAALIGVVLAIYYRRYDVLPRKRYDWEDEESDELEK